MSRKALGFTGVLLVLAAFVALGSGGWVLAGQVGQTPSYECSIKVPEPEPANLASLAKITVDQAMAAAQAAYPGTKVRKVALENENGCLVYAVELSNGLELKVDAGNGKVVHQEQPNMEERREGRRGSKED